MKHILKIVFVAIIVMSLAVSPSYASGLKYSGFLEDYYSMLQDGPKGGVKKRWLKPDVDITKYKKVMIDSVIFYYAEKSQDKGIDGNEMKELSDAFNLEFVNAMKGGYEIVSDPGPDVLRIRTALTNIKKSRPVQSVISTVIPVGLGISIIKKGVTDSWSGSGSTAMEMMAMDSLSGDVVALAVDEQTAAFTDRFTRLGSAKEAFKFWSQRLRYIMDESQRMASMRTEESKDKK